MNRLIAIARVDSHKMSAIEKDEQRFKKEGLEKISLLIPRVRILQKDGYKKKVFIEKPLLINYGFVAMDLEDARNELTLRKIVRLSKVVTGFIYRNPEDIKAESQREEDEVPCLSPVLVECISPLEAARLEEYAKNTNSYYTLDNVIIGSIIILQGYPFANMAAEVLTKRTDGSMGVRLLESGFKTVLKPGQIYYKSS